MIINHCFRIPIDQPGVHCKDPQAFERPPVRGSLETYPPWGVVQQLAETYGARNTKEFLFWFPSNDVQAARGTGSFGSGGHFMSENFISHFFTKTPAFSDFSVGGDSHGFSVFIIFLGVCRIKIYLGPPNNFHLSGKDRCKLLFPDSICT